MVSLLDVGSDKREHSEGIGAQSSGSGCWATEVILLCCMKHSQEPVMLLALPAESRVCLPSQLNLGNYVVSAQQNLECHPDSLSFVSTVLPDLCYALHSFPVHRSSTFPFNFP